jgi:hypothetical protein
MQYRWVGKCGWGCLVSLSLLGCGSVGRIGEGRHTPELAADGGSEDATAAPTPDAGSSGNSPELVLPTPTEPDDPAADPDGDGLSNEFERTHGSDPERADTDGDGVTDLIETVAGTDAREAESSPAAQGDFYFLSPYAEDPAPQRETLQFSTSLHSADLFILVDTTGSMQPVLSVLQERLTSTIVPKAAELIADIHIGVGSFEDVPLAPYGSEGDAVLTITQTPSTAAASVQAGVNALALGSGGDGPEGGMIALHALATGRGFGAYLPNAPACAAGGIGYACFRPDAVPIVLLISDAEFHNGPSGENPYVGIEPTLPAYADTLAALRAIHARVISIQMRAYANAVPIMPADPTAPVAPEPAVPSDPISMQMRALSRDTGAVTSDGEPLFFEIDNTASTLDARVVDAVRAVAQRVPIEVSTVLRDDLKDDVDATQLVERIEVHRGASTSVGGRACRTDLSSRDRDHDGSDDTFTAVEPGMPVCFDVRPRKNQLVTPRAKPAVFRAFIDVVTNGKTVLDTREVHFLVPAASPVLE